MSNNLPSIHIAPHASNVQVHVYNYPHDTARTDTPATISQVSRVSYPSHQPRPSYPLSTSNDETEPNQTTETHRHAVRRLQAQALVQMMNMVNRRSERPNHEDNDERGGRYQPVAVVSLPSSASATSLQPPLSPPLPPPRASPFSPIQQTAQPHAFQNYANVQQVMDQLRREGSEEGYTVSFELGTVPRIVRGLSLQELAEHTTIGLYKDLDDINDTAERGEDVDDTAEIGSDMPESKEDDIDTCSICQEQLHPFSIIRQIDRCNHFFHQACIEKWLGEHSTCPLCMQQISSAEDAPQTDNVNPSPTRAEDVPRVQQADVSTATVQERLLNLVAAELGI